MSSHVPATKRPGARQRHRASRIHVPSPEPAPREYQQARRSAPWRKARPGAPLRVPPSNLVAYPPRLRVGASMNFYPRHIGDYMTATAHLSLLEDGAYNRLLDNYYSRERPLPVDVDACCRIARAVSKQEKAAVATVLRDFFDLTIEGHRHRRCDHEIEDYRQKREKARQSARARWDKGDGDANDMRTHSDRSAEAVLSNNQDPVTNIQKSTPSITHSGARAAADLRRAAAVRVCESMEKIGCGPTNPSDAALLQALDEGVSEQALLDVARFVIDGNRAGSNPFGYAITTARDQHAKAQQRQPLRSQEGLQRLGAILQQELRSTS